MFNGGAILMLSVVVAPSGESLLAKARAEHEATVARIRTLQCSLLMEWETNREPGVKRQTRHRYFRSGDAVRIESEDHGRNFVQIMDGAGRLVIHGTDKRGRSNVTVQKEIPGGSLGDVQRLALFVFLGSNGDRVTFTELLAEPHQVHAVAHRQHAGRDCVMVDLSHARARLVIWLDIDSGYLVRRVTQTLAQNEGGQGEFDVTRMKEVGPALFFPEEVRGKSIFNGTSTTMTVHFTDIRVNDELAPALHDQRTLYQPGSTVHDMIAKERYELDDHGNKINPRFEAFTPKAMAPAQTFASATSLEDQGAPARWFFLGAALLVLVGAILWILGRRGLQSS